MKNDTANKKKPKKMPPKAVGTGMAAKALTAAEKRKAKMKAAMKHAGVTYD